MRDSDALDLIDPLAVAWAAGIVDGEGCITITKQRSGKGRRVNVSHRVYLKVAMGHRPTIERLKSIFGLGSITVQRSERWNDAYIWWAAAREAGQVLKLMRPHLVTKAVEADLAFQFLALPSGLVGGAGGNRRLTPELIEQRERLFVAMRDAKPSARFRRPKQEKAAEES